MTTNFYVYITYSISLTLIYNFGLKKKVIIHRYRGLKILKNQNGLNWVGDCLFCTKIIAIGAYQ